jgi:hypothetical protein
LCNTQKAMAITRALLTLELKFLNVYHLFFKDPKATSIIILAKFMILLYFFLFTSFEL